MHVPTADTPVVMGSSNDHEVRPLTSDWRPINSNSPYANGNRHFHYISCARLTKCDMYVKALLYNEIQRQTKTVSEF